MLCLTVMSAALLVPFAPAATVSSPRVVSASQVNGTWRSKDGEFKILALGKQRLRVEFFGVHEYRVNGVLTASIGEGSGIATIDGDTATFRPYEQEPECVITMKFAGGKMVVVQQGFCGFGINVSASGTYRRVSARKPTFDSNSSLRSGFSQRRKGLAKAQSRKGQLHVSCSR